MVIEVDLTGRDMWEIQQTFISAQTSYHRTRSKEIKTKSKQIMDAMYKILGAYAQKQKYFTLDDMNVGIVDYEV